MYMTSLFKLSSAAFLSSVISAAGLLALSSAAQAQEDQHFHNTFLANVNWQIEPYIGADAFVRNMRFKDEPTHPFQEHLDTFQPFVGVRLHKYFGVEAGYQQSEKGTKERFFHENETPIFFGGGPMRLEDPGNWFAGLDLNTATTIKGWNIGLIGFYPICKDKTELFAKVGYSNLDLDTEYHFDARWGVPATHPAYIDSMLDYGHLHDSTGMLKIGAGIKQALTNNFGARAFVNFERTSRLRLDSRTTLIDQLNFYSLSVPGADVDRASNVNIKPHNSWSYGVGVYYTWK